MWRTTRKWDTIVEDIVLSPKAQREQAALQASIDRMRAERLELGAQNRALQALIEREEKLTAHLREVLETSHAERQAIEAE
jgi:hypothetical protein